MKPLEIILYYDIFRNRFYFKDAEHNRGSWSVRKFRDFCFLCIINMKNNYHQTFVIVFLITYIHVKLTLFICYLFRLYKKHVKKE